FFPDRVELCGVKIAGVEEMTIVRKILQALRKKNSNHRFVAFSGEELAKLIGVEPGSIYSTVREFQEKIKKLLHTETGYVCAKEDIIENSGGYRFKDGIVMKDESPGPPSVEGRAPADQCKTAGARK